MEPTTFSEIRSPPPTCDFSCHSTQNPARNVRVKISDKSTRIVPGHGPVADRTALTAYRDMLVTVRDRVQKLKASGRTLAEVTAAKPTADLDATWGAGFMKADDFVAIVYKTLRLK